ncbi:transposase [Caloranaerobacter azorensis]|uniref:transposase n=1 Tax=Caloranaerobacter azorensis TaxID=116090 RepID=UPI003B84913D
MLRYCCGFEVLGKIPSESTFSRFLDKLVENDELEKLFHELVIKAKKLNIIDGDSIAIDSTKLNSYETAKPKNLL